MAHTPSEEQLPSYAFFSSDKILAMRDQQTRQGTWAIRETEIFWRDRRQFLLDHGYLLRARYQPDWTPSWIGTRRDPAFCEDAPAISPKRTMDARRKDTGELVAIKKVKNDNQEIRILKYIESQRDPTCHCVTILETLPDPFDRHLTLMFLPLLRRYNDPEFCAVGEVISFIDQSIEGLMFLHDHRIAHRDIHETNLLMDARDLLPGGWHPAKPWRTPDGVYRIQPRSRTDFPVNYFYIDFGHSARFNEGDSQLVVGDIGRDDTVPELSIDIPYEALPVDIHALGSLYLNDLQEKYYHLSFLEPLTDSMRQRDPKLRPTIHQVHQQWQQIRARVVSQSSRHTSVKAETFVERAIQQTVSVAWEGIRSLTG
ncbi:kinase-like protein [Epithele typhae]|uniref:kinase-like protein n=1 Tax=Epithele typhae TaxID=378194 RepID=UPI0020086BD9|nr:kinase-like protein [Epithele typhae]KAH9935120.1 kinase-like protein [Epithele typhae]